MTCTLVFGGDIAPIRALHRGMFGKLAPLFAEADIAVANLEIALTDKGQRVRGKGIAERGDPAAVAALVEAGLDAVNVANNHVLDYGEAALLDSLGRLSAAGLPYFGAGRNLAEAASPLILERQGLRVGFLGYTSTLPQGFAAAAEVPGVNPLRARTSYRTGRNPEEYPGSPPIVDTWPVAEDLARMVDDITRLKMQADIVLVYHHWGASMTEAVLDYQRAVGHAAIDAGASGVFGGHQHVISAIEFHKGCPIIHGMGNLLFDIIEPFLTETTHRTFLFKAELSAVGLRNCEVICCRAGVRGAYEQPVRLSPDSEYGMMTVNILRRLSEPFGTDITIDGARVRVTPASVCQNGSRAGAANITS